MALIHDVQSLRDWFKNTPTGTSRTLCRYETTDRWDVQPSYTYF